MSPQPPDDQHNWQQNTAKPDLGQWFYVETVPSGQGAGNFNVYPQADGTLIKEFAVTAVATPVPVIEAAAPQVSNPATPAAAPTATQVATQPQPETQTAAAPTGQPAVISAGPVHAAWGSQEASLGADAASELGHGVPAVANMTPANAAQIAL